MEFDKLIQKCFTDSKSLTKHLAQFRGNPAVFFPVPPEDNIPGWYMQAHYPRLVFNYDLQASVERNNAGTLSVSLLCRSAGDTAPERIEPEVRGCLRDVLLKPGSGGLYAFASAADAKKAAQEILDEFGHIKKEVTVRSPDVPYIRKGDMVYVDIGAVHGYYYVLGIRHDAGSSSMTMELELSDKNKVSKNKASSSKDYKAGDLVSFQGGKHYVSSTSQKGYPAKSGKARITQKNSAGKHPYHLIHADSRSNVYGWVDSGTFH